MISTAQPATKVGRYRAHLQQLEYLEYAHNHVKQPFKQRTVVTPTLNLSLWSDAVPPGVLAAAARALPKVVGSYCLAQDEALVALLSKCLGVATSSVLITAGADDALRVASHYCVHIRTKVLIPVPCFGRYVYHAMIREADIAYTAFDSPPYELDLDRLAKVIRRDRIECLYIASPNNPTGHALSRSELIALLEAVSCSVILDESLLLLSHVASHADLLARYPNLFICGSFSKLYGLAGLRVGYLLASKEHHARLSKLVSPFGVDGLAIEIAKHMLGQHDWLRRRVQDITGGINELRNLAHPQLQVSRTSAPIALLTYLGTGPNLHRQLEDHGISTVAGYELPGLATANAVRIIIRGTSEMTQLKTALANVV